MKFLFNQLNYKIAESNSILLISHHNPDPDTIGSTLALGFYIEALGKATDYFCIDEISSNFSFIKGTTKFNSDIDLLKKENFNVDLCYIDPPYGNEQSDYFEMYRFFEEFYTEKVLHNKSKNKKCGESKFVKSKNYVDNFIDMMNNASQFPYLMISYNDNSWASLDEIVGIISDFRKSVETVDIKYFYKYRNQDYSSKEYVIIAS